MDGTDFLLDSPSPERAGAPASERRVFTVSEVCAALKATLRETFRDIWVRGEISGYKVYGSGHGYFTLKDKDSCLKAVVFQRTRTRLTFTPEEGMEVLVRGSLDMYAPRGDAQIIVEEMEVRGAGALLAAFEQLKARLAAEGLFDPTRKKAIPYLPQTIGVVTSPDGAALRDFLRVVHRRNPNLRVIVSPTRVQGPEAKGEIVRALDRLEELAKTAPLDVVVLARGGGSLEDLWPFNEEAVARRVAACAIPTVSAVGHEVDFTIADFVADLRAATPSAAAERLAPERAAVLNTLENWARRLAHGARAVFHECASRYEHALASRGFDSVRSRTEEEMQRVDDLERGLRESQRARTQALGERVRDALLNLQRSRPEGRAAEAGERLSQLALRLARAARSGSEKHGERLERHAASLNTLNPLAVLGRGYSICTAEDRRTVLRDAARVRLLDRVYVRLHRGTLGCDVREKE
jgi:exodeoxyribonuclease VII large subunit